MADLNLLNDDILYQILGFLDRSQWLDVENVSRRFQFLSRRLWRRCQNLNLFDLLYKEKKRESYICDYLDEILLRTGGGVQSLSFHDPCQQTASICGLTLSQVARKYELSLRMIQSIHRRCPKLRSINISNHIIPSVPAFDALLSNMPVNLEELIMDYCRLDAVNAQDGQQAEEIFIRFLRKSQKLRTLSLQGRGSCFGHLKILSATLDHLSYSIRHLQLSAGQSAQIGDLKFCENLKFLQSLAIQRSTIQQWDVKCISECCPNLVELDLSYARCLVDFSNLALLTNLEKLILDGNRDHLVSSVFVQICECLPQLRTLSIENCASINSEALKRISLLTNLVNLNLANLGQVSDVCLALIILKCTQIQILNIKNCKRVTNAVLLKLKLLKNLHSLDVSSLQWFDNFILYDLLQETKLKVLVENAVMQCFHMIECVQSQIDCMTPSATTYRISALRSRACC